jgi:hypothetical protein
MSVLYVNGFIYAVSDRIAFTPPAERFIVISFDKHRIDGFEIIDQPTVAGNDLSQLVPVKIECIAVQEYLVYTEPFDSPVNF